jgi:hypothetical protein
VTADAIESASSSRGYTTDFQSVVIKFQPKTVALVFVAFSLFQFDLTAVG